MDSPINPGTSVAMPSTNHLQCVCGFLAFRCICFPEPGVMRLTCFGCGKTHEINVSAVSNLVAWNAIEPLPVQASQDAAPEQLEPIKSGYKYESMF